MSRLQIVSDLGYRDSMGSLFTSRLQLLFLISPGVSFTLRSKQGHASTLEITIEQNCTDQSGFLNLCEICDLRRLPCACEVHNPKPGGGSCKSDEASLDDCFHSRHRLFHLSAGAALWCTVTTPSYELGK